VGDGVVQMRYIGSGRLEAVLVRGKLLDELTGYAATGLVFMNCDTFLGTTLLVLQEALLKTTNGDDSLPRRVSGGRRLASRLLSG
jgi:hypothetical protein